MRPDQSLHGIVHILIACLVLSAQDAIIKWLVEDISLFQVLFVRSITIITTVCMIWMPRYGYRLFSTTRIKLHLVRVLLHFFTFVLFFTAISMMPLGDVIALALTSALFLAILSGPVLGEPAEKRQIAAAVVGFVGVLFIAGPTGSGLEPTALLTALGASVCYAAMSLVTRQMSDTEPSERMVLFSACGILVASGCTMPWLWQSTSGWLLLCMLGLGLVSTLGHWLLVKAYLLAPVHVIAPVEYSTLVWGVLIGALLFDETPSAGMLIGSLLIVLAGIFIVQFQRTGKARKRS